MRAREGTEAARSSVAPQRHLTLLMQLLDGDESLHQLRKGGGDRAPALHGLIQLVHLGTGQASGEPSGNKALGAGGVCKEAGPLQGLRARRRGRKH